MTSASDWQGAVGKSWSEEWRRTDTSFGNLTPHLLAAIADEQATHIVDVGCGAGELAIAVATSRPSASVIGVDISSELVSTAMGRTSTANLRFLEANASHWLPDGPPPDLYISRHGVMFFADPPQAFTHLAAVAEQGARMVYSCFRKPSENAWAAGIAALLPPGEQSAPQPFTPQPFTPQPFTPQPFTPGPFAFAEPDHIRRCMAGWTDHVFTPVDFDYVAGAGADPVGEAMALFRRIGPAASALRNLPQVQRDAVEQRLLSLVEAHLVDGHVTFPAAAWVVSATSDYRNG